MALNFKKETPRVNIKFIQASDNSLLFELKDKNHMEIGNFFSDTYVDMLIKQTFPDDWDEIGDVIVLCSAVYEYND